MQPKAFEKYTFQQEEPLTHPIIKEVVGPDAESLTIGFRLPGNKDKDVLLADLVGKILTNGKTGLLDLNLVKKQRLLRASAFTYTLIDYGILYFYAAPTEGQSQNVKGMHRTQLMLAMFNARGYSFRHVYGVMNMETKEVEGG